MIVCFRCTVETKDQLDSLLATGTYRDIGEAIAAAVRNQVLMEQEVADKGVVVIGGDSVPFSPPAPPIQMNGHQKEKPPMKHVKSAPPAKKEKVTEPAVAVLEPPAEPQVPPIFQLQGFPEEPPKGLAELPADMWSNDQNIPLDRWVLGQFNRLLPAKVNVRALIRLFLDSPKGLEIGIAASAIAAQAAVLGDYLRQLDVKQGGSRDDALATAFPSAEEGAEKGRTRYANQFVVYQNSKGELSGLMMDLKLINVVPQRKERKIVPTQVAWDFAALPNPLLDGGPNGSMGKFSPQERSFLIWHILRSVPVEAFAYRVILEAVREGHTSPEQIDTALKAYLDQGRAGDLSQSFLASQRSGAVSRMSDLGLIERRREGVRVYYSATEDGLTFLDKNTSHFQR